MNVSHRDEQITNRYLNEPDTTVSNLAHDFSISTRQVQNILKSRGVKLVRKKVEKKPLSDTHKSIGLSVYYFRNLRKLSQKDVAVSIGMTTNRLAAIERGVYNISVSDLTKIADYFNVKLTEILSNEQSKIKQQVF